MLNAAFVLNHQATPPLPTEACVLQVSTNFTHKKASQNKSATCISPVWPPRQWKTRYQDWVNLKTPAKCECLGD